MILIIDRYEPINHPSLSNIIDISKGGCHSFVKTSNNEIYAFGRNKEFQLGIKTEHEKQVTPLITLEENVWHTRIKPRAKSARSTLHKIT